MTGFVRTESCVFAVVCNVDFLDKTTVKRHGNVTVVLCFRSSYETRNMNYSPLFCDDVASPLL